MPILSYFVSSEAFEFSVDTFQAFRDTASFNIPLTYGLLTEEFARALILVTFNTETRSRSTQ